jgi:DnaK suppressor protein
MPTGAASKSTPSAEFVTAQRALLQDERQKILVGIENADRDLAELRDRDDVADVDFSEEGGEGAPTASERSHVEMLRAQLVTRLSGVDAALARLDSGTYGVCESCGGPIGEARLEAMPDATLCVACKSAPWTSRRR